VVRDCEEVHNALALVVARLLPNLNQAQASGDCEEVHNALALVVARLLPNLNQAQASEPAPCSLLASVEPERPQQVKQRQDRMHGLLIAAERVALPHLMKHEQKCCRVHQRRCRQWQSPTATHRWACVRILPHRLASRVVARHCARGSCGGQRRRAQCPHRPPGAGETRIPCEESRVTTMSFQTSS
jgi:hypothetical protein